MTTTNWIEETSTMTDNGKMTFEHDSIGPLNIVRMVYLDGTPFGDGHWSNCDDCDNLDSVGS